MCIRDRFRPIFHKPYILIHSGIHKSYLIFLFIHLFGVTTLPPLLFKKAPHQEKELLAIIKSCLLYTSDLVRIMVEADMAKVAAERAGEQVKFCLLYTSDR